MKKAKKLSNKDLKKKIGGGAASCRTKSTCGADCTIGGNTTRASTTSVQSGGSVGIKSGSVKKPGM